MRAFLSHSSRDKGFVEAVASNLRPGTFELDALTFDAGAMNSQRCPRHRHCPGLQNPKVKLKVPSWATYLGCFSSRQSNFFSGSN